jgi:aryl-alcohol dehydrogenase-like predicted oxidoreductase
MELMTTQTMITIGGDLRVGRVGYGAMRLTGPDLLGDYPDREGAIALLRAAVDGGVSLIDTADIYGPHSVELLIREALHPYPDDLAIATKGGLVRGGRDLSSRSAFTTCTAPGRGTPHSRITEVAAVTAYFNVAARQNAALLRAASDAGAVFCPWQPVSLIRPGVKTDTDGPAAIRRALEPIAGRHGSTIPQVALAWLLARSPAILPVPATTSIAHLRENLDARDLQLTPEELSAITALAAEDPAAPRNGRLGSRGLQWRRVLGWRVHGAAGDRGRREGAGDGYGPGVL